MTAPTNPLVGMAPALYWSAGGVTYEVDDPVFYAWLSASLGSRTIYAYDFDPYSTDWNSDRTGVTFRMFTSPPTILDPRRPLAIDRPVYLYVVDTTDPHLLRQDEFSPQQEGMSLYYKDGLTWAGLILKPDGTASPAWQQKDDHFVTFGELLTAAVVVWGGAFVVAAVAGAATVSTAAPVVAGESVVSSATVSTAAPVVAGESVVSSASTAAGGGELIASDFVGPVATGGTAAGGTVAASATAGTPAATTGSAAFSMSDVMGASKTVVAVAGAASKIEQAISGATVAQVPPAPESAPPKPPDNSWLALLGVAIILVLPP